jgi:hypothetical protein
MSEKKTAISDIEEERYQNENRVFKISNLQIMLDLNSTPSEKKKDAGFVLFTYDMYFHPDFEKDPPETTSNFPFFTNEVQYPFLQSKSRKECVEFFFNVKKFTDEIRTNGSNWVEPLDRDTDVDARNAQILENEKANIAAMLRSIFPISGQFGNALTSSYDNYILQNSNWEVLYGVDPMELVNIFGFAERFGVINKERNSSYIKINGKPKSIFSVTWENDIVNHPVYKKFIETYINQVKHTHMNQYEVYSGLDVKQTALNHKLEQSWASDSVKDQVYKTPKHMKRLCKFLGISDKEGIYKIEKQLNRINFDELLNKWKTDVELVKLRFRRKVKEATTAAKTVNSWKQKGGAVNMDMTPEEIVTDLKNSNTIGSLIHYLEGQAASSNDYDDYGRRRVNSSSKERDIIQRIIFKLTSLNSENGAKGLGAANIFSEVNDMITENNISLGEYSKMFKEYLNLAVEVEAANNVYLFVSENKPIRIAKNGAFIDGTKETETNKLVDRKMRELYGPILKQSEELANSVENVYTPKRKTSNAQLFELIELIKGKKKKGQETNDKSKSHVFEKIYRKYFAKRTMNYPLVELKPYMYTGVDTTITPPQVREEKDENKKIEDPGISKEFSEIYVRMNILDKDNYDKGSKSQCKLKEDILTNELHYLLDMDSMAHLNPFRDYRLLEEYIQSEKTDKTEEEPLPNKENRMPPNKKPKGGRSRRIRAKRLRKTRR